ncbi:MAG TPA: FtsQ-type POTRA domain-containing protein [Polyangiaceae bacterium]|jgi:cell division protein FtsQ|nr:FtsQ-type POTRA domain-containing protein [Polyangiaceae bacterium]
MTPGNRRVARPLDEIEARPLAEIPVGPRAPSRLARAVAGVRTAAGVALVIACAVGVAWVARRHVMNSPRFAITAIEVSGNERRPAGAIANESGLALGDNVFVADIDGARGKIAADPWIAEVTLARRLPGTILVHVTERRAAALVALGDTFLATADGEPFKKLDPDDPADDIADLPLVTGLRPESLAEDHDGTTRTVRRALDLAAEFTRSPLARRGALEEVHVEADGSYALVVGKSAMQVVLGAPPFRRKLDQASRVVAELDKRGAKADSIMVDNDTRPDRVVVRMR